VRVGDATGSAESTGRGSSTLATGTALALGGAGRLGRATSAAEATGAAGAFARDFIAKPPASTSPDASAPIPITHPIFAGARGAGASGAG